MLLTNVAFLVNTLVFFSYFFWVEDRSLWPDTFVWWAWVPYVLHTYLHLFMDGLQNTTRNIARIYLIKNHGPHYDNRLVEPIQHALIPDSMLPVTIVWQLAHISSFCLLLIFQGWGTALVAELGLMLFGGILPTGYQSHLRRTLGRAELLDSDTSLRLLTAGIDPDRLFAIIKQAIREKRNPQKWWGIVLRDALNKNVSARPNVRDGS